LSYYIDVLLIFFIFSFVGWVIEVVGKYFEFHRFINRGFLVGPCLPIYGVGSALITVSVKAFESVDKSIGTTFVVSFVICGAVEYFASYIMEKIYHARWWDYTRRPMNLNGRIWIGNLILFGLGGLIIYELLDPMIFEMLDKLTITTKEIISGILCCIFTADFIVSFFVMKLVKAGVESSEADSTEAMRAEIMQLLSDRSFFAKRFAEAYPDVIYKTEKIQKKLEELKAETEKLKAEAEKKLDEIGKKLKDEKEHLAESLESSNAIRNDIIEMQYKLLDMVYDAENASEDAKKLKEEIEERKRKLDGRRLH